MGESPHQVCTDVELKARADKICGNCKWWEQYRLAKEGDIMGTCRNVVVHKATRQRYSNWLNTPKDFGCIHFEPKT